MRKTKIICTLGPASNSEEKLRELMLAGADVCRFNFSHSDQKGHKETFDRLNRIRTELGLNVAALLDTKGPEVRVCSFKDGKVSLEKGQQFTLSTQDGVEGDKNRVGITYKGLVDDIKEGARVLLDDGLIELKVTSIEGTEIVCKVKNTGIIKDNKGVNIPGVRLSMPYLSEKDKSDILFGAKEGFDFIAASFVRCADDIMQIREVLEESDITAIRIIAKIENREGVENIDEILKVSDGIMIARGDLGVEIPLEEVPIIQKNLIKKAYSAGKQVITATQMLESMINNPRPTRAEATDVANAIYDGTSAIMLSGETAAGQFPIEAVKTMAIIADKTESVIDYKKRFTLREMKEVPSVTDAISHATCTTAYDLGATAIITVTKSGNTAKNISKYRPSTRIIGCGSDPGVLRQINLSWGVTPLKVNIQYSTDELFVHCVEEAKHAGLVKDGDIVVITAGVPLGISGTTNLLKVHVVGDILVKGTPVNNLVTCGNLCVAKTEEEAIEKFKDDDILVMPETNNSLMSLMKKASGIITEEDGVDSHAAIFGVARDIPVIVGAVSATEILKSGTMAKLDGEKGTVSSVSFSKSKVEKVSK